MFEYICFDFSPFGDDIDKKVRTLGEFLVFVDTQDALESFNACGFFTKIVKDVASGLCYLHGMVLFNLINPDLSHPFQTEFESPGPRTPSEKLKQQFSQKKLCFSGKYKHLQATDWLYLAP